jgi:hypothetical protein
VSLHWPQESYYPRIILERLRRRLYEEITKDFFTFKSARFLGICLNAMGLRLATGKDGRIDQGYYALHKTLLKWTQKNFLRIHADSAKLAEAALSGNISFDAENRRLVQTGISILGKPPHIQYLDLDVFENASPPEESVPASIVAGAEIIPVSAPTLASPESPSEKPC